MDQIVLMTSAASVFTVANRKKSTNNITEGFKDILTLTSSPLPKRVTVAYNLIPTFPKKVIPKAADRAYMPFANTACCCDGKLHWQKQLNVNTFWGKSSLDSLNRTSASGNACSEAGLRREEQPEKEAQMMCKHLPDKVEPCLASRFFKNGQQKLGKVMYVPKVRIF